MAQVKQLDQPKKQADSGLDPIAEARQKALTRLAEILFDYTTDDGATVQVRRGLQALMRGTGQLSMQSSEQTKVVLHLGQAIDAQTKDNDNQAAEELEHALEAGFDHPALYFDLGLLALKGDRLESARPPFAACRQAYMILVWRHVCSWDRSTRSLDGSDLHPLNISKL